MMRARLPIALPRLGVVLGLALPGVNAGLAGCGGKEGNEPNALPSAPASTGSQDDDDDDDVAMPTEGVDTEGPDAFPRTYRFDCVDIQIVGDGDGEAFQAIVLENAWSNDIRDHKLNILLTVTERDDAAGTAKLQVTSGVGTSNGDLCNEPNSISQEYDATFEPMVASWTDASDEMGMCSRDGAGTSAAGTYQLSLGPDDVVYVYAEDDDGTTFNCTESPDIPDAVPIRAVEARVTVDPGEQVGYGNLLGCLAVSEAAALCSCIGACIGEPHPDCGGCPNGSRPLSVLLDGINPSSRCTDLLGEDAFDLQLGMVTEVLGHVPEACG